jgi:hypothetical protein
METGSIFIMTSEAPHNPTIERTETENSAVSTRSPSRALGGAAKRSPRAIEGRRH